MKQILTLARQILEEGCPSADRTGTGTIKLFGPQLHFPMRSGFPMITTNKSFFKSITGELLAFLAGSQDNHHYRDLKCTFWDAWTIEDGRNGAPYGVAWRHWKTSDGRVLDQMTDLVNNLRHRPFSRRHVVTAWNPATLPDESKTPHLNVEEGRSSLAACHCMFQCFVQEMSDDQRIRSFLEPTDHEDHMRAAVGAAASKSLFADFMLQDPKVRANTLELLNTSGYPTKRLSLKLTQRSCDLMVGGPANVTSYSLLLHMLAQCTGMLAHELIWSLGDVHIYNDQIELAREQIQREPYAMPTLRMTNPHNTDLYSFTHEDFQIHGYKHYPRLSYPVSV